MSTELIASLILFFLAPILDHYVKSFRPFRNLMIYFAVALALFVIPDHIYGVIGAATGHKYLVISLIVLATAILLSFPFKRFTPEQKKQIEHLRNMTNGEKEILWDEFTDALVASIGGDDTRRNRVVIVHKTDVNALSLANAGILIFPVDRDFDKIQYMIDDFAISYLKTHKNLIIDMEVEKLREK